MMHGTVRFVDSSELPKCSATEMQLGIPYRVWIYPETPSDWYAVRILPDMFLIVDLNGSVSWHKMDPSLTVWRFTQDSNVRISIEC